MKLLLDLLDAAPSSFGATRSLSRASFFCSYRRPCDSRRFEPTATELCFVVERSAARSDRAARQSWRSGVRRPRERRALTPASARPSRPLRAIDEQPDCSGDAAEGEQGQNHHQYDHLRRHAPSVSAWRSVASRHDRDLERSLRHGVARERVPHVVGRHPWRPRCDPAGRAGRRPEPGVPGEGLGPRTRRAQPPLCSIRDRSACPLGLFDGPACARRFELKAMDSRIRSASVGITSTSPESTAPG